MTPITLEQLKRLIKVNHTFPDGNVDGTPLKAFWTLWRARKADCRQVCRVYKTTPSTTYINGRKVGHSAAQWRVETLF